MQTHTTSGPDEVLASTAETGPEDPLDALLKQIVGGYFVLTDGQGSVSKWSEPAELLFGRPAQEVLGQSFFENLIQPPISPAAQAWRGFLESAAPPNAPGRVDVNGRHADDSVFPLETVFVPVKLDEGFDFSLFLEDLGFELPMNLMLLRMRQQHPVVVRALRQAIEPDPQPWEGWRTAGTLVVFKPTQPTPWVEEELRAREAARAATDAEVEERLTNTDPGVQGSSVKDLDDAAAVVARLLSALERIDDLERLATGLPAQVDEARRDAEQSRTRAEAAEREAAQLRADLARAVTELRTGGDDPKHLELLARMDRLEHARLDEDAARASALKAAEAARAELAQRLERAEADRARTAEAIEGRVSAAVAEAQRRADEAIEEAGRRADSAKSAFESRIVELESLRSEGAGAQQAGLAEQLEQVRAEHEEAVQAARHELTETLERIERERERDAESARAELRAALERIEHVQRESDALRDQLTKVTVERHEAEGLAGEERRRLVELQTDAEQTRARIDALRESAEEAREEAAAVRAELAALQAGGAGEVAEIKAAAEELRSEQAAMQAAQAELAERADALARAQAELTELRGETGAGQTEELAAVKAAAEAQAQTQAELAERHAEIERTQEELAARAADLLNAQEDFARRHEEVLQAQAEVTRLQDEAAGARADAEARAADAARAAETLTAAAEQLAGAEAETAAEQAELRALIEATRAEREEFRGTTEHALAQLADVRTALREHESSISVQLPSNAVEHEELAAFATELRREIGTAVGEARGEIAALVDAEAALRGQLEALADSDAAVTARLEELAAAERATAAQLEERLAAAEGLAERVAAVEDGSRRLEAVDALTARLDSVESAGAAIDERLVGLARGAAELGARIDAVPAVDAAQLDAMAAEAATARQESAALREEVSDALRTARETAERVADIDRGAGSVLADVRAVRDRIDEVATLARAAHEAAGAGRGNSEELRSAVARLTGELQVARGELERAGEEALGARQAAATAQEAATAAREDAGKVREDAAAMKRELETGRERVTALGGTVERLSETVGAAAQAAEAARTEATAARRGGKELTDLVAEIDKRSNALRSEMGAGRERLQALDGAIDRLASASGEAGAKATAAHDLAAGLRDELAEVRSIAEKAAAGIDSMRSDVATVRTAAEMMSVDAESARASVKAGEARLEAMNAEVTFALKTIEDLKAGLTSAGQAAVIARREAEHAKKAAQTAGEGSKDNVTEVFAQLLGLAATKKSPSGIHRRPSQPHIRKPEPVKREPRHGFDDVTQPMAVLNLEGKFRELNPAFARLVGYQEHEFAKATWPSPHDRAGYKEQQEQLSKLAGGELKSVIVQSTYMHGQGLMVPVVGKLTAVPGEDGLPLHLLLEAEDRHTT